MAIALDNVATAGNISNASSLTAAFTCSGSDRMLFVTVDDDSGASSLVTGVTYAGTAMTKHPNAALKVGRWNSFWYLVNPASGSNNIVVTASGTCDFIEAKAISYTGVKQTGQPDATTHSTASATTSISTSITTVADNCWVVAGIRSNGTSWVANSGSTLRLGTTDGQGILDSGGPVTPAGAKSVGFSWTNSSNAHQFVVSFSPAPVSENEGIFSRNPASIQQLKFYRREIGNI